MEFDVASVKPSAPLDMQKLGAEIQAGKMPNFGLHINGLRVEFNYSTLRDVIVTAYKVKPVQVTGPAWLTTEHYDIVAKMPPGSTRDDVPAMLQTLLAERFGLKEHSETQEHPVQALVVAKGGPKLKESAAAAPLDLDAPLKPGEMQIETPDGPARMTIDMQHGGATVNMGAKGVVKYGMDPQTMQLKMTSSNTTMAALADTLSQMAAGLPGGGGREVIDQTGLTGSYEVELEFSLADMLAQARAQGMDMPGGGGGQPAGAAVASDPGGSGASVSDSLAKLGLKLESRKAPVVQIVVDSVQKTPTED